MHVFRHYDDLPAEAQGAAVAIGNFDGVHRGHRLVLAEATAAAEPIGAPLAVLTFEPHPRSFFRPDDPPFRLTPFRIRARLLADMGVAVLVVLPFDEAFSLRPADRFVGDVLVAGLRARHVVVGYDFCFGHKRQGNAETLIAAGRKLGFGVTVVTKATDEVGGTYSSSSIRDLLRQGRPHHAAGLLGRPWEIEGRVLHGDRRGRGLGYPTANIDLDDYLRPAMGVYAVRAALDTGAAPTWHDGVANIGFRPMFATRRPLLEVHLFDFDGDLYGRHMRVQLIDYLRPEARFATLDELVRQMDRDSAQARAALAASPDGVVHRPRQP